MSTVDISLDEKKEIKAKTAKPLLWVGMVSMTMLFAGLTSAVIVRRADTGWMHFPIPSGFYLSTVFIVLSSLSLALALKAAKHDKMHGVKVGVGITLALGAAFVFSQFHAFRQLIDAGIFFAGSQSSSSGSFLYVLAGLHLAHLFGGLIVLIVVLIRAVLQKYNSENLLGLELCSIFWHFLDVLWLYLFVFLLLII